MPARSVSLSGDHPDELKTLVDAVVAAYLNEIVNKEQIKRQARLGQRQPREARALGHGSVSPLVLELHDHDLVPVTPPDLRDAQRDK